MEDAILTNFIKRLKSIDIDIELTGNFPWVYLAKINNIVVKQKSSSEHGFVLGYQPIRANGTFRFDNLPKTFKVIRKVISSEVQN